MGRFPAVSCLGKTSLEFLQGMLTNHSRWLKKNSIYFSSRPHFNITYYTRIDAFILWCCRRLLRVSWTAKEIKQVNPNGNQSWIFIRKTYTKAQAPVLWPPYVKSWLIGKDSDAGRLGAGGEGDDRGWDGWMASLTGWTWVWVNSRSWWWTGRPGVLRFMGSQRVGHDWATDLIWSESCWVGLP